MKTATIIETLARLEKEAWERFQGTQADIHEDEWRAIAYAEMVLRTQDAKERATKTGG